MAVMRTGRGIIAAVVGLVPALTFVGALHDALGISPSTVVTTVILAVSWALASATLGRATVRAIRHPRVLADVGLRMVAVIAPVAVAIGGLARQLATGDPAVLLSWMINEEDNAQIVGIAREVLVDGPRGAELAEQFGTAFVTMPLALLDVVGGTPVGEPDVRLQAIGVFTVSALLVTALAGLAMMLIAALPHHVRNDAREGGAARTPTVPAIAAGTASVVLATVVGFSVLIVLPMRTGFLTFVWGLTLVLLAAAVVAVVPDGGGPAVRIVLLVHLISVGLLIASSWPFIATALLPLLLVPAGWIDWRRLRHAIRTRPLLGSMVGVSGAAAAAVALVWFLRWGPGAEVLSYGLGILTAQASGIAADRVLTGAALTAVVLLAGVLLAGRGSGRGLTVALVAPVVGAGALLGGLRFAAELLTEGELGYSGTKLLYGIVAIATVLGLVGLAGQAARMGTGALVGLLAMLLVLHQTSPTARLYAEWTTATEPSVSAHATAAVDAIRSSSADVPIRCLPTPGTVVTDQTRFAAYFCVRWMEDAFNEGRFDGHRFDLLSAEGPTFEATVERILEESERDYLFAQRMTMGPGWFGWVGPRG